MTWTKVQKDRWPNFSTHELACKHCGNCKMNEETLDNLQQLRTTLGLPVRVTSGYRCAQHPVEIIKNRPGSHVLGRAVDISCLGGEGFSIVKAALQCGFTGIGVSMATQKKFIHLDDVQAHETHIWRPCIWSY